MRPDPVVTSSEHFPYNKCPKADQNCAGLMRAERERHVTRRDVVSNQTEGNSVRVAENMLRVEGLSHKIVQVHQQGKPQQTAYNVGIAARLRTIRPKPIDILAVVSVTHHVCLQNLMAGAAHVIMNDDRGRKIVMNLLQNCITELFRISVTPIIDRQVLASATFSGPGTLLIRMFLLAVSACNHRNRTSR